MNHQVSVDSEELMRQVRRLFACYARMPNADELYSYAKTLSGLTRDELDHAITVSVKPREEDDHYRQPTDAGLLLNIALGFRRKLEVASAVKTDWRCAKCRGSGFKLVDENGQDCSAETFPRRAARCDCRQALKQRLAK